MRAPTIRTGPTCMPRPNRCVRITASSPAKSSASPAKNCSARLPPCIGARSAARALRAEGVRGLVGYFEARDGLPSVCYYLPLAQWRYLSGRDYWKDTREDLLFLRHDMVVNLFPLEQIVPRLEQVAADPHQAEILELMIHEQYF